MITPKLYEYKGEAMTLKEWAEKAGINRSCLVSRIQRKWPFEKAIAEPVKGEFYSKEIIDFFPIAQKERQELNMEAVNEFFNPTVGEGGEDDFNDTEKRVDHLKRMFKKLYKC